MGLRRGLISGTENRDDAGEKYELPPPEYVVGW